MDDPLNHGSMNAPLAVGMVEAGEAALSSAKNWDIPLLLMHAREDQLTDFAASMDFASRAKTCEFHSFDGVEHEMHNDSTRDEIYALMRDFIVKTTKTKFERVSP